MTDLIASCFRAYPYGSGVQTLLWESGSLEISLIDLTLPLFPWAKFRKTKRAIKLHAMIDLRTRLL